MWTLTFNVETIGQQHWSPFMGLSGNAQSQAVASPPESEPAFQGLPTNNEDWRLCTLLSRLHSHGNMNPVKN